MQDQYRLNSSDSSTAAPQTPTPLQAAHQRLESAFLELASQAETAALLLTDREAEVAALKAQGEELRNKLRDAEKVLTREQGSSDRAAAEERDKLASEHSAELAGVMGKLAKLEQENNRLHQQIAARSISGQDGDAEDRGALASLQAEKKMLEDKLAELEGCNSSMEAELAVLQNERDGMRAALDDALAELDAIIDGAKAEG